MDWDCWIGDENGATPVELFGRWQPKPRPWPKPVVLGSDHQMLDCTLDVQRFGYRRTLEVNLPRTTPEIKAALEVLYYRFADGAQSQVQVNNGDTTYLCDWAEAPDWEPVDDRVPERWKVSMKFLIVSEVEPGP